MDFIITQQPYTRRPTKRVISNSNNSKSQQQ